MARKSLIKVGLKLGYKKDKGKNSTREGRVVSMTKRQCLLDRQARIPVGEEWEIKLNRLEWSLKGQT